MGGGTKKPTLSQLEKKVAKGTDSAEKSGGEAREKTVSSVIPPPKGEVLEFIKTQPYVTPYMLAEKFGIRISIAKQVLRSLTEEKYVRLVVGNSRLRIYEPVKEMLVAVEEKAKKKKAK